MLKEVHNKQCNVDITKCVALTAVILTAIFLSAKAYEFPLGSTRVGHGWGGDGWNRRVVMGAGGWEDRAQEGGCNGDAGVRHILFP